MTSYTATPMTLRLTRSRYTDFLVNEVRKDGKVLHLEDYAVAEQPTDAVSCSCPYFP